MTTVGYGDMAPDSALGRILAILIMFCGISLIAVVTGTISSIFTANKIMEGKGLGNITFNNHTLICGWSNNINDIINSLIKKNKNSNIVLINNENEDTMNNILSEFQNMSKNNFEIWAIIKQSVQRFFPCSSINQSFHRKQKMGTSASGGNEASTSTNSFSRGSR